MNNVKLQAGTNAHNGIDVGVTSSSQTIAKPIVIRHVRCSWDTIAELEKGEFKDFGHMKLYCTHLSPKQVEKLLNAHGV